MPASAETPHSIQELIDHPGQRERMKVLAMGRLASNPRDVTALVTMGDVMLSINQDEAAKAYYLRACVISPACVPALVSSGMIYLKKPDFLQAGNFFIKALKEMPDNAFLIKSVGVCLINQGKYSQARDHFVAAINTRPDYAIAHFLLAGIHEKQGNLLLAQESLMQASQLAFAAKDVDLITSGPCLASKIAEGAHLSL